MSSESLLVLIGTLIALTPFSGLPLAWLAFLTPFLGGLVVIIGLTLASRRKIDVTHTHEAPAHDNA